MILFSITSFTIETQISPSSSNLAASFALCSVSAKMSPTSYAMYAAGSDVNNIVIRILKIVWAVSAFSTSYAINLFTSTTESDIMEGTQTLSSDALTAVIVFCVIYFAASICAGIGYTFGFKKIEVFPKIKKFFADLFKK